MYVSDITQKIRNFKEKYSGSVNLGTHAFLDEIINDIKEIGDEAVHWTIGDFLHKALDIEEPHLLDPNIEYCDLSFEEGGALLRIYDSNKFKDALDDMISSHDAEHGITWDTIDFYLNDYCKKDTVVPV